MVGQHPQVPPRHGAAPHVPARTAALRGGPLHRHLEDDQKARIEGCQGLVRSLAWKIHQKLPPYVELDDLICFGQVGLAEAAQRYDPERGGKFSTYAYYRVRGAIIDGLSEMSWFSRQHFHAARYEYMAAELLRGEGDGSDAGDVQANAGWFQSTVGNLAMVYLTSQRDDEDGGGAAEPIDENAASPPGVAMFEEVREQLRACVSDLPSDARQLIEAVYFEGVTLTEAGERLGISKGWASRLHTRTLERLASAMGGSEDGE